ncbi:MAG: hypothetical protein MUF51_04190, partial [Vicinamibacteria bacterium]|nr:hypothetical protein [Vicinamibacteria bacterium]
MPEDAPPPTATAWSPERILVRAPNWIGDAVLSLGALRDIHRNYTRARLTLLARPWVADVYRAAGAAFEILTSADHREDRARLRARAGGFDLAILLPNSFASAWSVFAARIPERWGYATDGRGILLTRRARVPRLVRGESQVYYYRAMLAGLGLIVTAVPDVSLACPADWSERAAERL